MGRITITKAVIQVEYLDAFFPKDGSNVRMFQCDWEQHDAEDAAIPLNHLLPTP